MPTGEDLSLQTLVYFKAFFKMYLLSKILTIDFFKKRGNILSVSENIGLA